jgi:hypothetical protein
MATIFTDGTIYSNDKLGMVNICLEAIGEVPYPAGTLVESFAIGTDAFTAKSIVEQTMIEVLNIGWYFNTDYDSRLLPDFDSFISMSPNTLRIDVGKTQFRGQYILKNKKVYDRHNQTFKIDRKYISADVVWLVDYEDLPPAAYNYISLRAARKFQQRLIGSKEIAGFTEMDEIDALTTMQREHLQYQDYNMIPDRMNRRTSAFLRGAMNG